MKPYNDNETCVVYYTYADGQRVAYDYAWDLAVKDDHTSHIDNDVEVFNSAVYARLRFMNIVERDENALFWQHNPNCAYMPIFEVERMWQREVNPTVYLQGLIEEVREYERRIARADRDIEELEGDRDILECELDSLRREMLEALAANGTAEADYYKKDDDGD